MHKLILSLLGVLGSLSPLMAQSLHTSYFMETAKYRHQLNPALLENAPYVGIPLLGNLQVGVNTNFGAGTFIYPIAPSSNDGKRYGTFLHPEVSREQFTNKLGKKDLSGLVNVNYNVFSVAFNGFGGTNLIELNLLGQANFNIPNQLIRFAKTPASQSYDLSGIGGRLHSYAELALGHARKLNSHLTIGAKAKLLIGAGYADIRTNQLTAQLDENQWRIGGQATGVVSLMQTPLMMDNKGRIDLFNFNKLKAGISGWGLGLDLGVTYQVHGAKDLKLSLGLTDIGFIQHAQANKIATPKREWSFAGFTNAYIGVDSLGSQHIKDELERLKLELGDMLSIQPQGVGKHTQILHTTLNLGVEYTLPVYRKLSFGGLYSHRFAGLYSSYKAMLMARIRPIKVIELGVSASTSTYGTNLGSMLSLQALGVQFFVGADYLIHKLSKQYIPVDNANANLNFGLTIPLRGKVR